MLDTINRENKNGVIMGDFNIDLLKFGSHCKTSEYLLPWFYSHKYPNQLYICSYSSHSLPTGIITKCVLSSVEYNYNTFG